MKDARHWLIRLYPASWRSRYGDELDELLSHGCNWQDAIDVARAALIERMFYSRRPGAETMKTYPANIMVLVRKPSAFAPIIMSLAALGVVVVAIAIGAAKPEPDENAGAHIWQLLMAGQLPILGWFAVRWLRRDLKAGLAIAALQIAAFIAALVPVWLLGL
ncbi:MAG TPA: hypothetical protein VF776_08050 [Sphingomicrobium sp.]